mmetsp:Transcript_2607/g.6230  ORF Transcript_2607/g.6230 Transcript_2607/m.6230 type:complete len:104 (-) Transcript_2607:688-999(-)
MSGQSVHAMPPLQAVEIQEPMAGQEEQRVRKRARTKHLTRAQLTVHNPEELDKLVAEVRENTIATSTRSVYTNSMIRFIQFLYVNESSLITQDHRKQHRKQPI